MPHMTRDEIEQEQIRAGRVPAQDAFRKRPICRSLPRVSRRVRLGGP